MEQRCQDVLEVSVSTEAFAIIAGVKWGFILGQTLWNIWKLDEHWAFQISPAGFVRKADVVEVSCLKPCGYDSIYKFKRGMAAAARKWQVKHRKDISIEVHHCSALARSYSKVVSGLITCNVGNLP